MMFDASKQPRDWRNRWRSRGHRDLLLLFTLALSLVDQQVFAQTVRPGQEPLDLPRAKDSDSRALRLPDVPDFEPKKRQPGNVLPPLERDERSPELEPGSRIRLAAIEVRGNTVLPETLIREIGGRYVDRFLGYADLEALRDEITNAYVGRGFQTSGAVLPEQSVADGTLVIEVVEGVVREIEIETDGRFREDYLRSQLARRVGAPANVNEIEAALQELRQDDRIRYIEAALVPSERRGESILRVRLEEEKPWSIQLAGDNYLSPSIGEGRGTAKLAYANLVGVGDVVSAQYQGSSGLNDLRGTVESPFTPWKTRIELHVRRTWSEVVEKPFDDLDIDSETVTYGFTLTQPAWRSRNVTAEAFMTGEWRRSNSFLMGEPISFSLGPEEGVAKIAVLRFGGTWLYRSPRQVAALRSMVSTGLDVLDATHNSGDVPDSRFTSWLLQLQTAHRLPVLGAQVVGSVALQLSDRPLLGLEQFSIGGRYSVRGYRENQLVRDQGVSGSVELRLPVPLPMGERWRLGLQLVPFVDAGRSWNANRGSPGEQTLVSVGLGAQINVSETAKFEVYWGRALHRIENRAEHALQDDGVHMGLTIDLP